MGKRGRDTGNKMLQALCLSLCSPYFLICPPLLLTFLLLFSFHFCCSFLFNSSFFIPPLFSHFKQSTRLHLILFWNNSFFTYRHTCANRNKLNEGVVSHKSVAWQAKSIKCDLGRSRNWTSAAKRGRQTEKRGKEKERELREKKRGGRIDGMRRCGGKHNKQKRHKIDIDRVMQRLRKKMTKMMLLLMLG